MNDLEFVGDWRQPQLSARQRALGHDGTSAGEFTFGDFLDIINPLQHLPIVSNVYRAITGDEISPHARILGDTLFGGPTGFLSSVATTLYEEIAGEDVGETVIAFFTGEDGDTAEPQFADHGAPLETAAGGATGAAVAPAAVALGAVLPEAAPRMLSGGMLSGGMLTGGMLTGQDALDALFIDLGGGRQRGLPLPDGAAGGAADGDGAAYPLPPRPGAAAPAPEAAPAVHPLLFAQEAADGALADRMMQALDKYEAMARQDTARRREADERQQDAAVLWQSDPLTAP